MDKEKEIKELASYIKLWKEGVCLDGVEGWVYSTPLQIAEDLYNAGYREIKEGSIIIEQYIPEEGIKVKTEAEIRQETAKEIYKELKDMSVWIDGIARQQEVVSMRAIKYVCKEYGVEID